MSHEIDQPTAVERMMFQMVVPLMAIPPEGTPAFVTSGFIVEVEGWWFWITAEHSFDFLDEYLKREPHAAVSFRPSFDPQRTGVLFAYKPTHALRLARESEKSLREPSDREDLCFFLEHWRDQDIGIYLLEDYYAQNLRAAGVVPLREENIWKVDEEFLSEWKEKPDIRYYISGAPASEVELDDRGVPMAWSLKALRLGTKDLHQPMPTFEPWWTAEEHRGGVHGMSGGPILIVCEGRVFWVGVQSSQIGADGKTPREIRMSLAAYLYELLGAIVASLATGA